VIDVLAINLVSESFLQPHGGKTMLEMLYAVLLAHSVSVPVVDIVPGEMTHQDLIDEAMEGGDPKLVTCPMKIEGQAVDLIQALGQWPAPVLAIVVPRDTMDLGEAEQHFIVDGIRPTLYDAAYVDTVDGQCVVAAYGW